LDLLKGDMQIIFYVQPKLIEINKGHEPNEGLKKSLEEDKEFFKNQPIF